MHPTLPASRIPNLIGGLIAITEYLLRRALLVSDPDQLYRSPSLPSQFDILLNSIRIAIFNRAK